MAVPSVMTGYEQCQAHMRQYQPRGGPQCVAAEFYIALTEYKNLTHALGGHKACVDFLTKVFTPARMSRRDARTYWFALALFDNDMDSMQVARQGGVEGHMDADDHSLCSELSHVACASQASGVVNVHNVDTAMQQTIRTYKAVATTEAGCGLAAQARQLAKAVQGLARAVRCHVAAHAHYDRRIIAVLIRR